MHIEVFDTADELATGAADLLTDLLNDDAATFGLAGGSTPIATYRELRDRNVPWQDITCWLADERWVPPDDPDANARTARIELVDRIPTRFVGPDTTLEDPHVAAAIYESILEDEFDERPDVVLLGIGDDGHTASLFPETDALTIDRSGYVANWVPHLDTWRLTATIPLLRRAKHTVFLASGTGKAEALRRILIDREPLPARLVADGAGDVVWLIDAEAACRL